MALRARARNLSIPSRPQCCGCPFCWETILRKSAKQFRKWPKRSGTDGHDVTLEKRPGTLESPQGSVWYFCYATVTLPDDSSVICPWRGVSSASLVFILQRWSNGRGDSRSALVLLLTCHILFVLRTDLSEMPVPVGGWVKLFCLAETQVLVKPQPRDCHLVIFPNGSNDPKPLFRGSSSHWRNVSFMSWVSDDRLQPSVHVHVWGRRLVIPSLCHWGFCFGFGILVFI